MKNATFHALTLSLWISFSVCIPVFGEKEISQGAVHTIHIVPQSHIDIAWLWRYDPETIHRCCTMTFTQALDNMDRFPDYTFSQSQVPLYEPLEKIYPDLYRRIKEYVREGRWEVAGGMYVEPEGGEPCGESWVRQCVMGKRWFRKNLGVDVTTGWQPDAWGHPAQLPQIMAKSGIRSYLWRRGDVGGPRNNVTEKMFWWQSPDGSKVLAYRFIDPENPPYPEWENDVRISRDRYQLNDTMIVIGWGDHGGGPTEKDIMTTKEFARKLPPGYSVKFSSFAHYIDAVMEQNPQLPTIQGDLGLELQGDLTNAGEIKKSNRECENLLSTAEKWATLASLGFSFHYPGEELDEAWKKILFNQFHDILGGSVIPEAVRDAMQYYQSVRDSGEYIARSALITIAESVRPEREGIPIIVFNPLSWTRTDYVVTELEFAQPPRHLCLKDAQGHTFLMHIVDRWEKNEKTQIRCAFVAQDVPSLGYKTFYAVESEKTPDLLSPLVAEENSLENEFFRIEIDPQSGDLSRIYDKRNDREVLSESSKGNQLIAIEDEGDSEGRFVRKSDVCGKPPGAEESIRAVSSIRVLENNPVRVSIRIEKEYQNSRFVQDVILYRNMDRIDFNLILDWHDIHRMIKVAFPFSPIDPEITYDVPYATQVRPADGMEYPAQKWVDLYTGGYGIALINKGRYAHDVQGNTIRLSILRSPTQPAYNTDEGIHSLQYSIYPHREKWNESPVVQRSYEFNYPLTAIAPTRHTGAEPGKKSFLSIQPENVLLEVVKKAYDSSRTVLRFCEKYGRSQKVSIAFSFPLQEAHETDLLENELNGLSVLGSKLEFTLKPYEIKTIAVAFK